MDPTGGTGREFVAPGVANLVHGFHQADVFFMRRVQVNAELHWRGAPLWPFAGSSGIVYIQLQADSQPFLFYAL